MKKLNMLKAQFGLLSNIFPDLPLLYFSFLVPYITILLLYVFSPCDNFSYFFAFPPTGVCVCYIPL